MRAAFLLLIWHAASDLQCGSGWYQSPLTGPKCTPGNTAEFNGCPYLNGPPPGGNAANCVGCAGFGGYCTATDEWGTFTPCPAGRYSPACSGPPVPGCSSSKGLTSVEECSPCNQGQYLEAAGRAHQPPQPPPCNRCPAGTWSNVSAAASLAACMNCRNS